MAKVALGMIVKNEAHCIERCLDSVKPLIDCVVVNDNGSTDGTDAKILEWSNKNGIPAYLLKDKWVSFDVNRSLVLKYCYDTLCIYEEDLMDYVLMIDADEVLVFEAGLNVEKLKESLTCDLYDIECRLGGSTYLRSQLTSNKRKFKYSGVVHEFIVAEEEIRTRGVVKGVFNMPIQDSARNKDPKKFEKDAEALVKAFNETNDPFLKSRYCFYAAQCFKDSNQPEKAIEWYDRRLSLGFWDEEKYIACLQAGRLTPNNKQDQKFGYFLRACNYSKGRAEALGEAMLILKKAELWVGAYCLGKEALYKQKNTSALFLESAFYDYIIQFEMSIITWYADDKALGYILTKSLAQNTKIPQHLRNQAIENLKWYEPSAPTPAMGAGS